MALPAPPSACFGEAWFQRLLIVDGLAHLANRTLQAHIFRCSLLARGRNMDATAITSEECTEQDLEHLRQAIDLSRTAAEAGDYPFGAVVAISERVIATSENFARRLRRPWMHAEHVAIQNATEAMDRPDLREATLYSSTEPCPMCCGLIHWADVKRLVYACSAERLRFYRQNRGFQQSRLLFSMMRTQITIVGPVLHDEAEAIHSAFWAAEATRAS